jgi:Rrf2 family protein
MSHIIALSEAATIGLHSMVLIARSKEMINVTQIAEAIHSSRHHVAKVMQRLSKDGYVQSNRGPNGGFVLRKDPQAITLLDIYECIEGRFEIQACPGHKDICPFGSCLMGDLSLRLSTELREYLAGKSLQDYLKKY